MATGLQKIETYKRISKRLKKRKSYRTIKAEKAKEFLEKPWYKQIATKEFAREIPGATAKVLSTPARVVGKVVKGAARFSLDQIKKAIKIQQDMSAPKSKEERRIREEQLERYREIIREWKEEHPGQSIPKEFQDLE